MGFIRNNILNPFNRVRPYLLGCLMIISFFFFVSFSKRAADTQVCNGIKIKFYPHDKSKFLTESEVLTILNQAAEGGIIGRNFTDLNLHDIEMVLDRNDFIKKSDIYTQMNDTLYVDVLYRNPVLRILSITHDDFYIDEYGDTMPTSPNHTDKILVATGYISGIHDTTTITNLFEMSRLIQKDSFLKALIGQIYVSQDKEMAKEFIFIPRISDLEIEFGDSENMEAKFEKLKIFYKKIYPNLEKDKYRGINLNFENQIILKLQINET